VCSGKKTHRELIQTTKQKKHQLILNCIAGSTPRPEASDRVSIHAKKMNLNLSASLNATRLLFKPSICLPHHTVSTFNDLPIPLDKGLHKHGYKSDIRAVVLDKDDCFAYPDAKEVYGPYKVCRVQFAQLHVLTAAEPFRGPETGIPWP
jgi:phosphatidylglycerophosphatase GEP4